MGGVALGGLLGEGGGCGAYRPAHGAVALPGDGVALAEVLAGAQVGAVRSVLPGGTRLLTPKTFIQFFKIFYCYIG